MAFWRSEQRESFFRRPETFSSDSAVVASHKNQPKIQMKEVLLLTKQKDYFGFCGIGQVLMPALCKEPFQFMLLVLNTAFSFPLVGDDWQQFKN